MNKEEQGLREKVFQALGKASMCLFSCLDDAQLKRLWDNSNLEYSL